MSIHKINKICLTPKTAYLTGFIIGDGSLANYTKSKSDLSPDYRVSIDISDIEHLYKIEKMIKTIIKTSSTPKKSPQRGNRKPRLYLFIRNKSLFYFFNIDMGIPKGKKSSIVCVPRKIVQGSEETKRYFLAGYFDADGGFRGNTLGFTTASKRLQLGISALLEEFGFLHSTEKWNNKRYNKDYYGIKIFKHQIDTFINQIPLQNKNKLANITRHFNVEMPERSNGIDNL